ncbi:hypothetical protein O6H91_13G081400 [Diphasiastrum complanatum]|nr:hypothetical protein O6H91_13G081400 [Diphasiastrum complanatum]
MSIEQLCQLPRYNSPVVQVILIGLVCFCCPGMFNVILGLGSGGLVSTTAANNSLTALYITFTVFGVLGGAICNILGPRMSVFLGCSSYVLYAGSFLNYNYTRNEGLVVAAGALLGVGASMLWAGQGAIMLSYPPAESTGVYISLFWFIFNLGGVLGGLIPFVLNNDSVAQSVSNGTYVGLMVMMAVGTLIALLLVPVDKVIRDDGSRITSTQYSNALIEGWATLKLFRNPKLLLLFPVCLASNFFYTYQFNNVNGLLFNIRSRSLNNIFYWTAQIIGSIGLGYLLDHGSPNRRQRGFMGLGLVALLTIVVYAGGLANQLQYSRQHLPKPLDFMDSGLAYAGPALLYISFGVLDSMFQTLCYWTVASLSSEPESLSRYSGFYKGVQSAGAAVAWQLDARKLPLLWELSMICLLFTISLPLLGLVLKDVSEDTKANGELEGIMSSQEPGGEP